MSNFAWDTRIKHGKSRTFNLPPAQIDLLASLFLELCDKMLHPKSDFDVYGNLKYRNREPLEYVLNDLLHEAQHELAPYLQPNHPIAHMIGMDRIYQQKATPECEHLNIDYEDGKEYCVECGETF